jgi:TPR repeat protein
MNTVDTQLANGIGSAVTASEIDKIQEIHKMAEHGNAEAQYNLGRAYHMGEGVLRDKAEAVKWCRKAAEQGNANAQNNLGSAYGDGEGVAQDKAEAAKWYGTSGTVPF